MAGTLTVQNLQGPSTGANANKIIIPSGQTLDASAGFVPPAGSVIQVKRVKLGELNTTSSTFTDIPNLDSSVGLSITPTSASNDILIFFENHVYTQGNTTSAEWTGAIIRLLRGGSYIYGDTGTSQYGVAQNLVDTSDRLMSYSMRHHLDSPNTTSEITYKLQALSRNGSTGIILNRSIYGSQGMLTLMEIAG